MKLPHSSEMLNEICFFFIFLAPHHVPLLHSTRDQA